MLIRSQSITSRALLFLQRRCRRLCLPPSLRLLTVASCPCEGGVGRGDLFGRCCSSRGDGAIGGCCAQHDACGLTSGLHGDGVGGEGGRMLGRVSSSSRERAIRCTNQTARVCHQRGRRWHGQYEQIKQQRKTSSNSRYTSMAHRTRKHVGTFFTFRSVFVELWRLRTVS